MKYINVIDFKCKDCNCKDYKVIDLNKPICICNGCGKIIDDKNFKIEIDEIDE